MHRNKIIQELESAQVKTDIPDFAPGDTVVVQVRVREGSAGAASGLRRRGHRQAQPRPELGIHGAQDFPWRRRGAHFPRPTAR